jgi:hypothetical protein
MFGMIGVSGWSVIVQGHAMTDFARQDSCRIDAFSDPPHPAHFPMLIITANPEVHYDHQFFTRLIPILSKPARLA